MRAAVAEQQAVTGSKFIALGVAAEVVVIVEDKDFRIRARKLAVEMSRGKAADAATDYDQIIRFVVCRSVRPFLAVA